MAKLRGEPVTTAQVEKSDKLRTRRTFGEPKFYLAHHPESWEWRNGEWLPRLKAHYVYPGINGTDKNGNPVLMLTQLRMDGWVVIEHDEAVCYYDDDGELVETRGYMLKYDGQRGPIYKDCWSVPATIGAGRNTRIKWEFDHDGYDLWRKRLVESGKIAPPSPHVLKNRVDLHQQRLQRNQGNMHNPVVAQRVAEDSEQLTSMQASLDAISPPKPKRGKRGKAANA